MAPFALSRTATPEQITKNSRRIIKLQSSYPTAFRRQWVELSSIESGKASPNRQGRVEAEIEALPDLPPVGREIEAQPQAARHSS